jgi:hypothetical protein
MSRKLKLVLALTQDAASRYAAMIRDYTKFFSNQQGAFLGHKNTYQPKDEAVDDPSKRSYARVITTVPEKLTYFIENTQDYIQNVLTKERTNGKGLAKAELIVAGDSWGEFTSNELLCLKSILDKGELATMIGNIPVRTETDNWAPTTEEEYLKRNIFQKPLVTQIHKTTVKESFILQDPNLSSLKNTDAYKPQLASKDTVMELGVQTRQEFSGQWSHLERANAFSRLTELRGAVTIALEKANDVEVEESILTSQKLFGFIFEK